MDNDYDFMTYAVAEYLEDEMRKPDDAKQEEQDQYSGDAYKADYR